VGCGWDGNTVFLRCGATRPERKAVKYDDGVGNAFGDGGGDTSGRKEGVGYNTARENLVVALVQPFAGQVLTNLRDHDHRDQDLTTFTKCQILVNSHHRTTNHGPILYF